MNGSGCKTCPVKPCETMQYRGSTCAAQRAKHGLGDPMTNADRIRAMSDEELAKWILKFVLDCAVASGIEEPEWEAGSEKEITKWLQQTAKEG